jgi:small-conductance mechanosensitive channel
MMAVLGVLVLARIWDIELRDFVSAGLANRIGEALFQIIVTLILASALWGIIKMLNEPELADNFLQPLKSQGVHRMEPTAYVIRVKFMAKPGEQFILRREIFRRLHETFREHGIRLGVSPVVVDGARSLAAATAAADAVAPPPPVPRTTG